MKEEMAEKSSISKEQRVDRDPTMEIEVAAECPSWSVVDCVV